MYICDLFKEINKEKKLNQRGKVLLLQLIRQLIKKPSLALTSTNIFIQGIQLNLIETLLECCLSQDKSIYIISTEIFLHLINSFRVFIKREIHVFMQNITLSILNSNHSSCWQKNKSLNVEFSPLYHYGLLRFIGSSSYCTESKAYSGVFCQL